MVSHNGPFFTGTMLKIHADRISGDEFYVLQVGEATCCLSLVAIPKFYSSFMMCYPLLCRLAAGSQALVNSKPVTTLRGDGLLSHAADMAIGGSLAIAVGSDLVPATMGSNVCAHNSAFQVTSI